MISSSGALATQYTYDPFGNVTPGSSGYGTMFGMGGIELDPTGLYHADARYYNPTLQRFLSEDPAGYGGGAPNLFLYSGNGPIGASDPSGLDPCPNGDCAGGGGGDANSSPSSAGGLDGLIESVLQAIFGQSPASTAPRNFGGFQAQHGFLKSSGTAGIDHADLFAQGDGVIQPNGFHLVGEDEDEAFTINMGEALLYVQEYTDSVAESIAEGHAFTKHAIQNGEFPGVKTPEEFKALFEKILMSPTDTRTLADGGTAYWDNASQTIVIFDPKNADLGTAYKPLEGIQRFRLLR